MATYESNTRWAQRTKRQSVQMWLPRDVVEALDAQAQARTFTDPTTGKTRKVGRAEVVTELVREGRGLWSEVVDMSAETAASYQRLADEWRADFEDMEQTAAQAEKAQRAAEKHADRLSGEVDGLKERLTKLEQALRQKDVLIESQNRRILELEKK